METETQILWHPQQRCCDKCGLNRINVRRFTDNGSQTFFCSTCWGHFVIYECDVIMSDWQQVIDDHWNLNIALILEFYGGSTSKKSENYLKLVS